MVSKIMQVYYGNDLLPYKDKERATHYPLLGNSFLGASNTTEIRFYIDKIGRITDTWVANSKLPNGKYGYNILEKGFDETINENYVSFKLNSFHTQAKGDLYISLNGFIGGVKLVETEQGTYTIDGVPTVQATGSVKLAIYYATPLIGSDELSQLTLQQLLAMFGDKLDISSGIIATSDISELNPTLYEPNQVLFDKATNNFYKVKVVSGLNTFDLIDFGFQKRFDINNVRGYLSVNLNQSEIDKLEIGQNVVVLDIGTGTFKLGSVVSSGGVKRIDYLSTNSALNDKNGNRIDTTYATKTEIVKDVQVDDTSVVENQVAKIETEQVSGVGLDSDTLEIVDGKLRVKGGSSGSATWGSINGNIDDQTDLANKLKDIREIASGKSKTYILSYQEQVGEMFYQEFNYYKLDGTKLETYQDFLNYVHPMGDDYENGNESFNSQEQEINTYWKYFVFRGATYNDRIVATFQDIESTFKNGDNILVIERDVPDRWYSGSYTFNALETQKVDLSNVVKTSENQTIGGIKTFTSEIVAQEGFKFNDSVSVVKDENNNLKLKGAKILTDGDLLPTSSYDLGSSANRYGDLYLSGKVYTSDNNLGTATNQYNTLYANNLSDGTTTKTMSDVLMGIPKLIDIGSETFIGVDNKVFPQITNEKATEIYNALTSGIPVILKWTIFGSLPLEYQVLSSDNIGGNTFDILVHNEYLCEYTVGTETNATCKVVKLVSQNDISATDFMTLNAEYEMIHFSAVKTGKLLTIDMIVKCLDASNKRFGYVNESYRPSHTHNVHCCVGANETDLFYIRGAVFIYSFNGAFHNSDTSMKTGEYAHLTTSYII